MDNSQQYVEEYKAMSNGLLQRLFRTFRMYHLELTKYTKKDDVILDCGCGDGYCLKYLRNKGYKNLYGIDIEKEFLSEIKNSYNVQELSVTEVDKKFPKAYFDTILCYDLFHHLVSFEEYERVIMSIKNILKKNGYLFIADPENSLFNKIMMFMCGVLSPISSSCRGSVNGYNLEKKEIDLYFKNKDLIYEILNRNFKMIKTKSAFYRSITIFQKI